MPGRCVTSTCALNAGMAPMLPIAPGPNFSRRGRTSRRARAGQELVGLDVLRARVAITSAGMRGAGGSWSQPVESMKSRTYCLSNDGGDVPGRVRLPRPVARRVGRHHLVDHDDLVVELAELELRVGEDQPAALRVRARRARRAAARGPAAARTRRRRRARPPRRRSAAGRGRDSAFVVGVNSGCGQLLGLPQPGRDREPADGAPLAWYSLQPPPNT